MKNTTIDPAFLSYRTLWGSLAGIVIALIFIIFFSQTNLLAPLFGLIIASWISKLVQPKNLVGLAFIIGLPAGAVTALQFAFSQAPDVGLVGLFEVYILASGFFVFYLASFIFTVFYYAQIIRLYRRGALF